jgi:hypothetical protein
VYPDGELTSAEGAPAVGTRSPPTHWTSTPTRSCRRCRPNFPQASLDLFFSSKVGKVALFPYSVVATSQQGGQLVVVVGPDGAVQSVNLN